MKPLRALGGAEAAWSGLACAEFTKQNLGGQESLQAGPGADAIEIRADRGGVKAGSPILLKACPRVSFGCSLLALRQRSSRNACGRGVDALLQRMSLGRVGDIHEIACGIP